MSDDHERDTAAEAFNGLRVGVERQGEEIALLRRAIEGLAVTRVDVPDMVEPPDYSETLGRIIEGIAILMQEGVKLGEKPALKLTPETLVAQITAAGSRVRAEDRVLITEARRTLDDASRGLHGHIKEARSVAAQKRTLIQVGLGGIAAGALLWSVLPGFVARNVAPTSWHWPERMATTTLGADTMWNGAKRLGSVASPANWDTMVEGAMIVQDNRETLDGCRKAVGKTARTTKCTVTLSRLDVPVARGDDE